MRPTQIGLPIPTQKTPAPYAVQSTNRGDSLGPNKKSFARKGSFSKDQRFSQYREMAKRTGPIGPGAYALAGGPQTSCKVRFSPPRQQKPGFYMSGNLVVFDPDFDGFLSRSSSKKKDRVRDFSHTWKQRLEPLAKSTSFIAGDLQLADLPKLPKSRLRRRLKKSKSRSTTPLSRFPHNCLP